jgi:hypothetical protein
MEKMVVPQGKILLGQGQSLSPKKDSPALFVLE